MGSSCFVLLTLIVFFDWSKCTKLKGLKAITDKNMDVMKMFDRFYHVRHKDEFFKHNVKNLLQDKMIFRTFYRGNTTDTLEKDYEMHFRYFANTGWYSTSLTELFSILYVKYLTTPYIFEFNNCSLYYRYGERGEKTADFCEKISLYFLTFMQSSNKKIFRKTRELLKSILENENELALRKLNEALNSLELYFIETERMIRFSSFMPEKDLTVGNSQEFFKQLLLRQIQNEDMNFRKNEQKAKFFFRNLLFGTALKNDTEILYEIKKQDEILLEFNYNEIQEKTIEFWQIAESLVEKIETSDPKIKKSNFDDIGKGRIVKSNATELLRDLEIEKLAAKGIDRRNRPIYRLGIAGHILQIIVSPITDDIHRIIQFIPIPREILQKGVPSSYPQPTQTMKEQEFSPEEFISASDYVSISVSKRSHRFENSQQYYSAAEESAVSVYSAISGLSTRNQQNNHENGDHSTLTPANRPGLSGEDLARLSEYISHSRGNQNVSEFQPLYVMSKSFENDYGKKNYLLPEWNSDRSQSKFSAAAAA